MIRSIDLPNTADDLGFTYDADGQRVQRSAGSDSTNYVGGLMEVDLDGATVTETRKLYGFGGVPVAVRTFTTTAQETTYLFTDHLGSVVSSWNDTTNTRTLTRYFPYGTERHSSGEMPQDQRYTGQTSDATANASGGSGLLYYNARYYDPTTAQFTQPDTIVPAPANPADLNRYSYVRGNPVRYTDASGNDPDESYLKRGRMAGMAQIRQLEQLQGQYNDLTIEVEQVAAQIRQVESDTGALAPLALYAQLHDGLTQRNEVASSIRFQARHLGGGGPADTPTASPYGSPPGKGLWEQFLEGVEFGAGVLAVVAYGAAIGTPCKFCWQLGNWLSGVSFGANTVDTAGDCSSGFDTAECRGGAAGLLVDAATYQFGGPIYDPLYGEVTSLLAPPLAEINDHPGALGQYPSEAGIATLREFVYRQQ